MDSNFYDIGPGFGAFVATFVLAVTVILIYRSMSKHLRKVRLAARDEAQGAQAAGAPAGSAETTVETTTETTADAAEKPSAES